MCRETVVARATQPIARSATLLCLAAALALVAGELRADSVVDARYVAPVERYGHFALGRPHEYAGLTASTRAGRTVTLQLPQHEVFEDIAPRIVRLTRDGPDEILAVVSSRDGGSRLVVIGSAPEGLAIRAQSAAIGTPMRWLNPVGVADLDDDGEPEIAAVVTPHLGGTLKVFRRRGERLIEIAALAGFSNHVFGSPVTALAAPVSIENRRYLLVPDAARQNLRLIAFDGNRLIDKGQCALPSAMTGAIASISPHAVSIGLASGPLVIDPRTCLAR